MPNVIFALCACGHRANVPFDPREDCHPFIARLRCSQCGSLGRLKEWRLGWMPEDPDAAMRGADVSKT